jgi:diguanylate cyclase (GGDEF)-like protein
MKTVRELLSAKKDNKIFSISPDAKVLDGLTLMAHNEIGALVVLEGERLIGVMSERDYARKVILKGKSSRSIPVREIMTADFVTVRPSSTVEECMALVSTRRCRHLPVCEDNKLMGIISTGDLVKELLAEQEETIRRLESLASHDPLTGLFNRSMFMKRLQQATAQAARSEGRLAVLFVDLDGFKVINDMHGHDAGDALLSALATQLHESMRKGDTLARLGGDEFVVLIEGYQDGRQLLEVARKLLGTISQRLPLSGVAQSVTASIGIAAYPHDGQDAQQLLKNADSAMYRAKERGKNRVQFYSAYRRWNWSMRPLP